jgi:hypothetical protein
MVGSVLLAAAMLLIGAGGAKLAAPAAATAMVRRSWPRLRAVGRLDDGVRVGGTMEIAAGLLVIGHGGRLAAGLLAAGYLTFLAVSLRLVRAGRSTGRSTSCGCFGRADSPVGVSHVVLNVCGLAAGVAAMASPVGPVGDLFTGSTAAGLVGVAQAGLLAYLGFLSITALPALAAERRRFGA